MIDPIGGPIIEVGGKIPTNDNTDIICRKIEFDKNSNKFLIYCNLVETY